MIQPFDDAVDRAALGSVDHRIGGRAEQLARGDHVGAPEVHHRVAVGERGGLVQQNDPLAVEEVTQLHRVGVVRISRQRARWVRLLPCRWIRHPVLQVLVPEDGRTLADVAQLPGDIAAGERLSRA